MQLSEAIILGDTLKKCDPDTFISADGSCGCAFGGALLAAGVTAQEFISQMSWQPVNEIPIVKKLWPWLTEWQLISVSTLYYEVAVGTKTIEDVAAYVRTIEPRELPDLPLSEQHRLEEIDAEREALVSGRDPIHDSNGRW